MRVAIVNDVRLVVETLRRVVTSDPRHKVVWTAENGEQAVQRCASDKPDVVLMDLLMPGMNGAEATRQIMQQSPCAILIVTSTVAGNFPLVCEALGHGAFEAVSTPELGGPNGAAASKELLSKLERVERINRRLAKGVMGGSSLASAAPVVAPPAPVPSPPASLAVALPPGADPTDSWRIRVRPPTSVVKAPVKDPVPVVAIGSSTGGPPALQKILSTLPADFPAAVVIAQHIGAEFSDSLVSWLQSGCRLTVRSAANGDELRRGTVLLAGTDDHLVLTPRGRLAYTPDPVEYPYRPAVDSLFHTLAAHWPRPGVAVLLTGIGRDGAEGMLALKNSGWRTIAQDQATSVVYGMPQAAAQLGAALRVMPLPDIPGQIIHELRRLTTP